MTLVQPVAGSSGTSVEPIGKRSSSCLLGLPGNQESAWSCRGQLATQRGWLSEHEAQAEGQGTPTTWLELLDPAIPEGDATPQISHSQESVNSVGAKDTLN